MGMLRVNATQRHVRSPTDPLPEQNALSLSAGESAPNMRSDGQPLPVSISVEWLRDDRLACIGRLTSGMVHELNNPIGYLHTNLCVLRKYLNNLAEYMALCETASTANRRGQMRAELSDACRRLSIGQIMQDMPDLIEESLAGVDNVRQIVRNLRNFSGSELQGDWERADLQQAMDAMIEIASAELKFKATIVREYSAMPAVLCIAGQIRQVFLKLLIDAGQAAINHGEIRIRMGSAAGYAWIQVDDGGAELSADRLHRMFDPPSSDSSRSTGLGPWVSRGIVEKHGGRIRVERGDDTGSRFCIELPIDGPERCGSGVDADLRAPGLAGISAVP